MRNLSQDWYDQQDNRDNRGRYQHKLHAGADSGVDLDGGVDLDTALGGVEPNEVSTRWRSLDSRRLAALEADRGPAEVAEDVRARFGWDGEPTAPSSLAMPGAVADAEFALANRDLVGRMPGWGWEQYASMTAAWRKHVGELHPDDRRLLHGMPAAPAPEHDWMDLPRPTPEALEQMCADLDSFGWDNNGLDQFDPVADRMERELSRQQALEEDGYDPDWSPLETPAPVEVDHDEFGRFETWGTPQVFQVAPDPQQQLAELAEVDRTWQDHHDPDWDEVERELWVQDCDRAEVEAWDGPARHTAWLARFDRRHD